MPLVVPCTACPAKLRVPESAAGKQIRCPKCEAVVDVPVPGAAEEVPVVDAKVAPVRPKPVVADDDDEEVDTEDARPRRKKRDRAAEDEPPPRRRKKRKAANRGSGGGVVLTVIVGLLLVCGVATGAFFLARKGTPVAGGTGTDSPSGDPAQKPSGSGTPFGRENPLLPADPPSPVPVGWQQYSNPDAGFKAYFPKPPIVSRTSGGSTGPTGIQTSRAGWELFSGGGIGADEGVTVKFWVQRFSHGAPSRLSDQLDYVARRRAPGLQARPVRWLGHDASEVDLAESVVRVTAFGDTLVAAQVIGPRGLRPAERTRRLLYQRRTDQVAASAARRRPAGAGPWRVAGSAPDAEPDRVSSSGDS